MEERAQSKYEMAEIPVVLSSTLLLNGEAWLADAFLRTAAVTSKTFVSLTTMPNSMQMDY